MKVLIIGGTGLISTAISRQLLAKDVSLTLFNRGQSAIRFPEGAVKIINGDRNQSHAFEAQMQQGESFDCVIDMICYTPEQAQSAVRAFQGRTQQFLFCSTVDVYSKPAHRYPIREDEPRMSASSYGQNKIQCEDVFREAHVRGDFAVTIIRPAMTYGEGGGIVDTWGWSTRIFDRLLKGKPILVHGDGTALWCACHVDDVAPAFVNAISANAYGKAYHVTGEEWMPWNHYYQAAAAAIDAPSPTFVHVPSHVIAHLAPERSIPLVTNFQGVSIYDNSAARMDLGFSYTISWIDGVRRTYQWLLDHHRIENSDDDPLDDQIIQAWEAAEADLVRAFQSR